MSDSGGFEVGITVGFAWRGNGYTIGLTVQDNKRWSPTQLRRFAAVVENIDWLTADLDKAGAA